MSYEATLFMNAKDAIDRRLVIEDGDLEVDARDVRKLEQERLQLAAGRLSSFYHHCLLYGGSDSWSASDLPHDVFYYYRPTDESLSYLRSIHEAFVEYAQEEREYASWMERHEEYPDWDWDSELSHFAGLEADFVVGIRPQKALSAWRPTCRQRAQHRKTWEVQKCPVPVHRRRRRKVARKHRGD